MYSFGKFTTIASIFRVHHANLPVHPPPPQVGSNWRLKVSNLKKVSAGALDYYADCLQLPAGDCRRPPDVLAIAETHDSGELAALLQLVLGCAVNSPRKQDYITEIMGLEEELQRNIMTALQELETVWLGGGANTPTGARGAGAVVLSVCFCLYWVLRHLCVVSSHQFNCCRRIAVRRRSRRRCQGRSIRRHPIGSEQRRAGPAMPRGGAPLCPAAGREVHAAAGGEQDAGGTRSLRCWRTDGRRR